MEDFYEQHARLFYRLLAHRNETEIRALREGFQPIVRFVKTEDEFIENAKKLNKERNVYAVIREKDSGIRRAARSEDIVGLNLVVIDIDPVRKANLPATDEELVKSIEVSQIIGQWFREHGFQKPVTAISGNGVHLYFSLPYLEINDDNRLQVQDALEFFESEVRRMFKYDLEHYGSRIDSMYDLPRIGKIIGSRSFKGIESSERPNRLSYFIDEDVSRREDTLLLRAILEKNLTGVHLHTIVKKILSPVWLMQPIPYFGEKIEGDWIVEPKIDGWRMEVIKNKNGTLFYGRRLEKKPDWTEKLSNVIPSESLLQIPDGTILDCELYTEEGRRFIPSLFGKKPQAKPIIYVFDILYFKGKFVGNLTLKERKRIISEINLREPFKIIEYKMLEDIEHDLEVAVSKGHEGIVIKEFNSQYTVGRDSPMATSFWRKLKPGRMIWQSEDSK